MIAGASTIDLNRIYLEAPNADDPVAQTLDWSPLNQDGPNFKSQELRISSRYLRIKTSRGLLMFAACIACIGFLALAFTAESLLSANADFRETLFISGFAFVCIVMGYFIAFGMPTLTLDKSSGYYYRGKYTQGALADVHAIQVVSKLLESRSREGDKSMYRHYQINLILKDGSRVNAMSHGGDIVDIKASARQLGDFLRVPVWMAGH